MAITVVRVFEPTSGATTRDVAVDTVATREYQLVKLAQGVAGTATLVSATDPLPVSLDAAGLAALENITVSGVLSGDLDVGAADSGTRPLPVGGKSGGNPTVLSALAATGQRVGRALDNYGTAYTRIAGLSGALANVAKHDTDDQAMGNYFLETRAYMLALDSAGHSWRLRVGPATTALSLSVAASTDQYLPNILPWDVNLLTVLDYTRDSIAAGPAYRPVAAAMQTAAVANGNGSSLTVAGYAVALIHVVSSVAMSGGTTVNFEASVDDTTWVAIAAHTIGTNGSLATTTTADGDYRIQTAGFKSVRARISGYSAGTVTITGYVSPTSSAPTAVALAAGSAAIGSVTVTGAGLPTALGQTTMAASLPVTIASDQPPIFVAALWGLR